MAGLGSNALKNNYKYFGGIIKTRSHGKQIQHHNYNEVVTYGRLGIKCFEKCLNTNTLEVLLKQDHHMESKFNTIL